MDSVTVDDGFYCSGLQNCIVGEQIWKECKDNASHRLNTRNEHLFLSLTYRDETKHWTQKVQLSTLGKLTLACSDSSLCLYKYFISLQSTVFIDGTVIFSSYISSHYNKNVCFFFLKSNLSETLTKEPDSESGSST